MNTRIMNIIKHLQQAYPDAGPMLKFSSRFELLVAVVLSAQSTDEQVNRVTAALFERTKTPADFAALELDKLEELVKGVGLFKNKAKSIKNLSIRILEHFDGEVPNNFEDLISLPGVGRKSANVVLSVAFNQPGLGVDTHVQRVANRIGMVREKTPEKTELALKAIIPRELWSLSHHLLIFHGRRICKARKPDCEHCCIEADCKKIIL